MFFHQRVFLRRQARGFAENCVGNPHFADVVQERGNFEIAERVLVETELFDDVQRPFKRQTCAAPRDFPPLI
jgi:hypothetical protein